MKCHLIKRRHVGKLRLYDEFINQTTQLLNFPDVRLTDIYWYITYIYWWERASLFYFLFCQKTIMKLTNFRVFREREREKDDLMVIFIMGKFQKIWWVLVHFDMSWSKRHVMKIIFWWLILHLFFCDVIAINCARVISCPHDSMLTPTVFNQKFFLNANTGLTGIWCYILLL